MTTDTTHNKIVNQIGSILVNENLTVAAVKEICGEIVRQWEDFATIPVARPTVSQIYEHTSEMMKQLKTLNESVNQFERNTGSLQ